MPTEETREPRLVFVRYTYDGQYQANTDHTNPRGWGSAEKNAVEAMRAILPDCKMFDSFKWILVEDDDDFPGNMVWVAAVLA